MAAVAVESVTHGSVFPTDSITEPGRALAPRTEREEESGRESEAGWESARTIMYDGSSWGVNKGWFESQLYARFVQCDKEYACMNIHL